MSDAESSHKHFPKGNLARRVGNVHMLALVLIMVLVTTGAAILVCGIVNETSQKLVRLYSVEAMGKFNLHVNRELALVRELSRSTAIVNWFTDEENPAKRTVAYNAILDHTNILQSVNVYFGINKSLHEYSINRGISLTNFLPFDQLNPADIQNSWYYNCIRAAHEYSFNIDADKVTALPYFWINHKVTENNTLLGVVRAGLPLDEMTDCLFSQYNGKDVKGYIIDNRGYIQMDSSPSEFFFEEKGTPPHNIGTMYPNSLFVSAMNAYLTGINGYFDMSSQAEVIRINHPDYMYVSIMPIADTDWSVVTFFNNKALYGITRFFPLLITMLSAFVIYTLISRFFIHRFIFIPLYHLTKSLSASNFYIGEIFGCDRNDEIGILAQMIQKMRDRLSTYNAELLHAARERERLIRIDQLTAIPNRRSFDERLPLEWGRAIRTKTPISLLILDLDYFKNYNDTYGHLQGDKALQVIAKVFAQEVKRSSDLVARWGGEEFAILLANTDNNGALDIAERIRRNVEDLQIPLADGSVSKMTISIGINSFVPATSDVLEAFIHDADMALYTAKREGRNRVCLYNGILPSARP